MAPTHWAAAGGAPLANVRQQGGGDAPAVDASWTTPRKLRLGPIRTPAKSELVITLPGLRDLLGAPLRVEPVALEV